MSSLIVSPLTKITAGVALLIGFAGFAGLASVVAADPASLDARGLIMITGIDLIVLGSLAATSGTFARHYPSWRGFITCLWGIGFITFLWGIWILFYTTVLHLDWLRYGPIWWITFALSGALEFALGVLFGYALLMLLTKRGEQVRLSLVPYEITLGNLAIALGFFLIFLALFAPVQTSGGATNDLAVFDGHAVRKSVPSSK
jgi:hypothetical protein